MVVGSGSGGGGIVVVIMNHFQLSIYHTTLSLHLIHTLSTLSIYIMSTSSRIYPIITTVTITVTTTVTIIIIIAVTVTVTITVTYPQCSQLQLDMFVVPS